MIENNIKIVDFDVRHLEKAAEIAWNNYEEEQRHVPLLPEKVQVPDLSHFAENNLGVAAFEGEQMLGFLGAYSPMEDAFESTGVRGTFSPIHAHGVISSNTMLQKGEALPYDRGRIYSLLYKGAAVKWVKQGILSHAIAIYAHDKEAVHSFFCNGFGLRCIDAIRSLDEIPSMTDTSLVTNKVFEYQELPQKDWGLLLDFHNKLITHLGESPSFMRHKLIDEAELYRRASDDVRYFAVKADGKYAAYIKIADDGENFATEDKGMMNICGAYCSPVYRGTGVYHNLLCYMMTELKTEGYQRIGVDFESINPTACGFWKKYFTEYTHSVVRRIDDKAIDFN